MRHYETTYILRPNLGEEQFTEIIDRTNAIITGDEGTIISLDRWGMKKLAYEIKKEIQGYYVYISYAAPSKSVDEIERLFKIDDRLLRYLTIKLKDSIDAEGIEKELQSIAAKTAALEAAQKEEEESGELDSESKTGKPDSTAPTQKEAPAKEDAPVQEDAPAPEKAAE